MSGKFVPANPGEGGFDLSAVTGPIRRVALTGSMASGKSTAARFLAANGVPVVDADELARRVVAPGSEALNEIAAEFGPEVISPGGALDREALGRKVFGGYPSQKKKLEDILHPRIRNLADDQLDAAVKASPCGFAVYDVPLLFEAGLEDGFDLIVTVYAEREQQLERGAARTGLGRAEIEKRLDAQLDLGEKARRSHVVLDNRAGADQLERQVRLLCSSIAGHNAVA